LETQPQPWALASDDEGRSYMFSSDTVEWATNKFEYNLFPGAEADEVFVDCGDDGGFVPLREFHHRRSGDRQAAIHVQGLGDLSFGVMLANRGFEGACVWWNMLDLHSRLRFHGRVQPGRWAAAAWNRWARFLEDTCGLAGHMMNKAPSAVAGDSSDRFGSRIFDDERAADFRMCSSHAVVALLTRWAFGCRSQGGLELYEDRAAAQGLLEALLEKVPHLPIPIYIEDVRLSESGWPQGSRGISLPLSSEGIRLSVLASSRHLLARAICRKFPQVVADAGASLKLSSLLDGLLQDRKDQLLWSALKQVIQWVGKCVDTHLRDDLAIAAGASFVDCGRRAMDKRLSKYFLGIREAFHRPQVVHMAIDQGTVGKKPTVVGLLALPDNSGAIFPPQVRAQKVEGPISGVPREMFHFS